MTSSPEFDAALAMTVAEREKADGIKSLVAASKLAATYQGRAEKAEAALARVSVLCDDYDLASGSAYAHVVSELRSAMKATS